MSTGDRRRELERALTQENVNQESQLVDRNEPVATEPLQHVVTEKDLEKLASKEQQKETLQRLQSASSDISSVVTDAKSETPKKKPWYKKLNPLKRRKKPPVPSERTISREYYASFLSVLTFHWMNPLMTVGYLRPLELGDIWLVNPERRVEILAERLHKSFNRRAARGDKSPLLWAMHETFKYEFWLGGLCNLFSSMFQVFSPYTTRYLISFATQAYVAQHSGQSPPPISHGIGLVIGITFMQVCQSLGTNHFIFRGMMVGGQARAVLIEVIFEKAMKISGRAKAGGKPLDDEAFYNGIDAVSLKSSKDGLMKRMLKDKIESKGPQKAEDKGDGISGDGTGWSNGKIMNLMSVDTYRVDQAAGWFHMTWTSPIMVCVTLVVLCINLGYSALAGFALLAAGVPALTIAIKSLFKRRRKINKITDQRVSLTQEILSSVRFVKFFGWESSFLERLKEIRKREIHAIQILLAIRNGINAVSMAMPVYASMLAFVTYSLSKHVLNPAPIFSSLALFNSLRMPLNLLPLVIGQVTDASASLGRIQEFLLAEEQAEEADFDKSMDSAVEFHKASFTWERTSTDDKSGPGTFQTRAQLKETKKAHKEEKKQAKTRRKSGELPPNDETIKADLREPFKLQDIDFAAGRGELLAVIGTVGSGKSSLLAALAGDMRKTGGAVKIGAQRAFCPQYAWIQNTTLKENIVFGKDFDQRWYDEVIDACALRPDLEMLPGGDATEIGERGITVSGGQKQRLNIARAIYFDADIVLMDDPLSAVDAHVGRHIMDKAICGILKDKCRILATHQLHVLNRCDRIIWMEEGRIESIDTFDNLMRGHEGFQKLMATTAQEEDMSQAPESDGKDVIEDKQITTKSKRVKTAGALMTTEERAVKSVGWNVWKAYIQASGSLLNAPLIVGLLVCANGANIVTSLWLSFWTSNKFGYSEGVYIGVYVALGFSQAILMYMFSTVLSNSGTNASKSMLQNAMTRVLRAPMSFFDTTPLGRITNRFSKDIDSMDNNLTDAMRMYFLTLTMILSVFGLIIAYFHYFAIALVPLYLFFMFAASYYRASAREIKRHESVLRSHLFARFSESISGTASIRAYGLQDFFTKRIRDAIDEMDSAYFLTFSNQRWLSTRLDCIGNLLVFTTGILVVTSRFNVSPSIAGLVLSYILSIVQLIQFTVRQLAEVENNMNATERLHYYGTELDEEAPLHLRELPSSWPQAGQITFDNVKMRYRAGLPLVLRGLNLNIRGGERIGIVGRTGAGKSSIMSTLFRLTELSGGSIRIDDVDIASVGLHDLRSRLAIIPQDPTLFRGTIRSNLDPFNEHSDLELWSALRKADLVEAESVSESESEKTSPFQSTISRDTPSPTPASPTQTSHAQQPPRLHLDTPVNEEGLNFSLGQRQLMALARALVRNSRIIVCDEATSSVDFETDEKIQRTMAQGFKGKTLLCIAHRLKTIVGYDRILVMDEGMVRELGTPKELWRAGAGEGEKGRGGGVFRGMCERSGIRWEDLGGEE